MRILFSSLGSHGHTYPLLPLAVAARDQGHEIAYATGESLHAPLAALGFDVVDVGIDMRGAFASAHPNGLPGQDMEPDELRALIVRAFAEIMPRRFAADLGPVIDRLRPDLVVHELMNPGAGLAARLADVPALCHGFGRHTSSIEEEFSAARQHLELVAAELGTTLPEGHHFILGNPYLDICPPSFQDPAFRDIPGRIELRPVPFAEPGELPAWVREHDHPLVYLTLGTAFGTVDVLRKAIEGLTTLDARVLVAAGPSVDAGEFGDLPDNVTVRSWVPQADLLPFTDLVVHHGGSGTTLGALGAGVPQLVLPQGADQFGNAEAVLSREVGDRLLGAELDAEAVAVKAKHLLTDGTVRDASRAVAAEIAAMQSPEVFAGRLAEYAR